MSIKTSIELRLFVTDHSAAATRALDNLKAVCEDPEVARDHDIHIELIDVNDSPQSAEEDKILVTPTLLKKLPLPVRRIVGDLSNEDDIFVILDIKSPRKSGRWAGSTST